MSNTLTHLDPDGNPRMVDISQKNTTDRCAIAQGWVLMHSDTLTAITDKRIKKGDVLQLAQLAGIMGSKKTSELIPLCHPIPIDGVSVNIEVVSEKGLKIEASVKTHWRTGVEMEALTAVTAAALTIYDMTKAIDKSTQIHGIRLIFKSGGKSGVWRATNEEKTQL
ncbi:MAG: cyclic pyranopterin monophosphate synthase MoaC [Proteobacteria bacterium]|nr:cyclic pyranopterin monophosphate synthase MoaC [Pseudomonadota bacterium]